MELKVRIDRTLCYADECPHARDCANHTSAGDHRTEGGETPRLVVLDNNSGVCYGPYDGVRGFLERNAKGEYFTENKYYEEYTALPYHPHDSQQDEGQPDESEVIEMALCETEHLGLRPNVLYRFSVRPECRRCAEMAAAYEV